MSKWPRVVGEYETLQAVINGASIGRFGDGEFGCLDKRNITRQTYHPKLTRELRKFIAEPHENCLVGIPTMDARGAKYENWVRSRKRYLKWLDLDKTYYSAFITRPDSGIAMNCQAYADLLRSLWHKKKITLVGEMTNKVLLDMNRHDERVSLIGCPSHNAYEYIGWFESAVVKSDPDIAILCCGPTATVLANRLAGRGIHAVDLGSVGGLLLRW